MPTVTPLIQNCLQSNPEKLVRLESEREKAKTNETSGEKKTPESLDKGEGESTNATEAPPPLIQSSAELFRFSGTAHGTAEDVASGFVDISNVGGGGGGGAHGEGEEKEKVPKPQETRIVTDTAQVALSPEGEQVAVPDRSKKPKTHSRTASARSIASGSEIQKSENIPISHPSSHDGSSGSPTVTVSNIQTAGAKASTQIDDKAKPVTSPSYEGRERVGGTSKVPTTFNHEDQTALQNVGNSIQSTPSVHEEPRTGINSYAVLTGNDASIAEDSEELSSALNDLRNSQTITKRQRAKGSKSQNKGLKIKLNDEQTSELEVNKQIDDNENPTDSDNSNVILFLLL